MGRVNLIEVCDKTTDTIPKKIREQYKNQHETRFALNSYVTP